MNLTIEKVLNYKGFDDIYCINQKCKEWELGDRHGCKLWGNPPKNCGFYIPFTNLDPSYHLNNSIKRLERCKISLERSIINLPIYEEMKILIDSLTDDDYISDRVKIDVRIEQVTSLIEYCKNTIPKLESFIANFKEGDILNEN